MQRALTLILVLTIFSFGLGIWVDAAQQNTARCYLDGYALVRELVEKGRSDAAAQEQAYLHARWQHDEVWLNCLISHHHTRAVSTAMLTLATALEQRRSYETLAALDQVADALREIETSDSARWENIL